MAQIVLVVVLAAGCGPASGAAADPVTVPEAVVVSWAADTFSATIPIAFTNTTGREVFLWHDSLRLEYRLDKSVDGGWALGWGGVWEDNGSQPIVVGPGEVVMRSLNLWGTSAPNTMPRFETDPFAGDYRVELKASWSRLDRTDELPIEARSSAAFHLE